MLVTTVYQIGFAHIYSHEGHPWNEMVDSLCTIAKSEIGGERALPFTVTSVAVANLQWAILGLWGADYAAQFPI
eukprot:1645841-Karenia_brevis.AAC.1